MADGNNLQITTKVAIPSQRYQNYEDLWEKCRDCVAGEDQVHSKEKAYLPKLEGMDQVAGSYNRYLRGAYFFNATGRTKQGYTGLIFRKDPDINLPAKMDGFKEDCTMSGKKLVDFIEDIASEELEVSRIGILVDYPQVGSNGLTQAEAEQQGMRPYFAKYCAEDILFVKTGKIDNKEVITQVRLHETYKASENDEDGDIDEFEDEQGEQIRVLDLVADPAGDDPNPNGAAMSGRMAYRQRIYKKLKKDDQQMKNANSDDKANSTQKWYLDSTFYPKMANKYIDEIPFFIVGGPDYKKPWLLDLVNVNLHHYVTYADYSRGVAWTTRPQPWKAGPADDEDKNTYMLGAGDLWQFPENTQLGMLEYSGQGLKAVEKKLDDLKGDMAVQGARMLMPEKKATETAQAHEIKRQGENASLASVAKMIGETITNACRFAAQWMGIADLSIIGIHLNTDYMPVDMPVADLVQLWGLYQGGGLTLEDYLWNIKQGERLDPSVDDDEREAAFQTKEPNNLDVVEEGDE